ncbi:flagellar hook-associated protein FlgK [Agrobacterium rosae]|uniref:Flagellar hook-associated protein 1 n=1 Tax=Agrobacterium rosae TaxID=1972867 RepID=A0A1R3TP04_9HYPH|nr:flagellar hook-associated protein FlgK [Agrobacterium rosae]KAA3514039.1 flagellar hook-associated protein FlgK [Agrobacterium rosae]KAA3522706.1 flagellar hook-associated protein FlgK [Agrobacterium rosae]MBN7807322.1 flagellar hook-associated protein FlgK [Agrobacterium rosae]MCM2434032.1 flagellar hook-associated protein FlgK [Agrobacterium rosae]MDX8314372.1 flagellar hook-associated protein FlgK [Agrobacterium rosae]
MSLASALNTTKATLSNTAVQTGVLSNNISNASTADYNRRTAITTTNATTGAITVKIERTEDTALLKQALSATSDDAGRQTFLDGMNSLSVVLGGTEYTAAPSTYLAAFQDALQTYAASPSDVTLASAAISAATDVANSLNTSTQSVQQLRADADGEIATTVGTLNKLLSQFEQANNAVTSATATGNDPNNALDQREGILKQISGIVGISTAVRSNNDIAIYTSDGTTLFETTARKVSFDSMTAYDASATGSNIYIDGVAVKMGEGSNTTAKGSLPALLQLRDQVYPNYQAQLDEIARSVMGAFAETDGNGDAIAGLFTTKDGSDVDFSTAEIIPGLAGLISVSADATATPTKLRDGSIAGDSPNVDGSTGYSELLYKYAANLNTQVEFDPKAGISTNVTLLSFATDSAGWVEEYRSNATTAAESSSAMLNKSTEAYSNSTGVNLDEELIQMLDIEQSYKAAAKLMSTIDELLKTLMEAAN